MDYYCYFPMENRLVLLPKNDTKEGKISMSKSNKLSDLVEELQEENEKLQSLKKLFDQACKKEFGYNVAKIHQMISAQEKFEAKKAAQQGQRNQLEHSEN